jgi:hypothetical protein
MSAPGQFLLYTAPDGAVKVDVFIQQETVWLTQKALAELFGVKVPAINKHLKNIFESGGTIFSARRRKRGCCRILQRWPGFVPVRNRSSRKSSEAFHRRNQMKNLPLP